MDYEISVQCPWCFEWVWLSVPADDHGSFVHDCDVCCRPWAVYVWFDDDGEARVDVDRAQ